MISYIPPFVAIALPENHKNVSPFGVRVPTVRMTHIHFYTNVKILQFLWWKVRFKSSHYFAVVNNAQFLENIPSKYGTWIIYLPSEIVGNKL
jgi:hypothetical protein